MITAFRKLLIRVGKILPFVLCIIVAISYFESIISLLNEDYLVYNDSIVLDTEVSFVIADKFEYDLLTIFTTGVLSIATSTCVYNKLAVLYLFLQLAEKKYFITVELYPEYIYAICIINICTCAWLCWNGLIRILKLSDAISWFRWITYKVIQK